MLVISDFNGTLSHGSPIIGLVRWVGENQSKLRKNMYMAKIMPSWFLAKRGLIDWNKWVIELFISCMPVLKDATPELFEEVIAHTIETQLWPKRRLDMIERISGHVQQGDDIYIATGMWQPTVAHFAAHVGAKGLGTEIKFKNGQMTLAEPIAHGQDKAEKIGKRLGVERIDVAYGDTSADIPMLEMADHPVAVYPDDTLKAVAQERGWEIFGDRADD
ncbi:MAG: HAD-IB family phosphatase [Anaerolineae bacterium]|jgi:HAD superfamily phosphoserine phosphatase-like hydrolase|nr:HAD-IB family phosphatase [Anaerolineae bacterium]